MIKRITYLLMLGMLFSVSSFAQKLTASAPSQVQLGQRFQVTWQLDANGSNFTAPQISDFQVLGGPNQSTSMQYVNGSMSQSISFSFVLRAAKEGEFTIAPAKIKVGGKIISSNELKIKVIKGQQQASGGGQQQSQQKSNTQTTSSDGKDLFAKVEVSKRNAYLGEKITVDLKIYSRVTIVNFDDWKMPSFEGFWSKETTSNQQIQLQNEVIDGVMYQTGLIKQLILYPQKTGDKSLVNLIKIKILQC